MMNFLFRDFVMYGLWLDLTYFKNSLKNVVGKLRGFVLLARLAGPGEVSLKD